VAGGHVRLPTPPTTRTRPRRLKKRARDEKLQPRLRSIQWPGSLQGKENPRAARAPGSGEFQPSKGYRREKVASGPVLKQSRHRKHPCHAVLLISASRAGSPRPLDGRRCQAGSAKPPPRTIFTDQRLEGWLAQAPRWTQMQRRGRPGATPHGPTDQRFEA
jgi:hypothetical protein